MTLQSLVKGTKPMTGRPMGLFEAIPVRALSWKNPYAQLMLHGKIETRTWNTNYRGWVLICASKAPHSPDFVRNISGETETARIISMELTGADLFQNNGMAIAVGWLSECRPMTKDDERDAFVEYQPRRWCHIYTGVRKIEPFPWTGSQGWKILTEEQKQLIKFI